MPAPGNLSLSKRPSNDRALPLLRKFAAPPPLRQKNKCAYSSHLSPCPSRPGVFFWLQTGLRLNSYERLNINTDEDPLFRNYHQAVKEKRMVVILPEGAYGDWLTSPADATRDFLVPFPADRLVATPEK